MAEEDTETKISRRKINFWLIISAVLFTLLILSVSLNGLTGKVTGGISKNEAGEKVINFFELRGITAKLVSVKDEAGLYAVTISADGGMGTFYLSKDGSLIGTMSNLALLEEQIKETGDEEQPSTNSPKTDKPVVELFVMSFCPYGVQAENLMRPVVDLLGNKVDIKVRFIASVQGTTVDSVQSLHGINEAKEDLRQLCVAKYYPQKYWAYLMEINEKCYSASRDTAQLDTCWKNAAKNQGVDVNKIETCAYGSEGIALLKEEEAAAESYGVTSSPTIIINGGQYSGSRSAEAFKQAICDAFNTAPAECSTQLSNSGGTASGGCG